MFSILFFSLTACDPFIHHLIEKFNSQVQVVEDVYVRQTERTHAQTDWTGHAACGYHVGQWCRCVSPHLTASDPKVRPWENAELVAYGYHDIKHLWSHFEPILQRKKFINKENVLTE